MTKKKQEKKTENTLDQQIDEAMLHLVESNDRRMENLGLCRFTRNYLAGEIHIEAECACLDDKQQLARLKKELTGLNSMTDTEYGKKFGGIVTLEFIEDLTNEDIKDIFFYTMHNIQEWVK